MSAKYLTTFAIILFNLHYTPSYADNCAALDEKLNRVLYILESTFNVDGKKGGVSSGYGGIPLSGKSNNIYTPKKGGLTGDYAGVGSSLGALNDLKNDYKAKKKGDDLSQPRIAGAIKKGGHRDKSYNDAIMYDNDKEIKEHGYSDQDAYLGAQQFQKDHGSLEALDKEESYLNAQGDGFVHENEYSGVRVNDSIAAIRRSIVREEQEINEDFFTDYNKENHEGAYDGGEFDVGYKSQQLNGGFSDKKAKTELQQSRYADASKVGENNFDGKDYNKDAYSRGEDDKDAHYRNLNINHGGNGGGYGAYNEVPLYDKFSGKELKKSGGVPVANSGDAIAPGHAYAPGLGYGINRENNDKEKDYIEKFGENEFGNSDKYGHKIKQDDNIGLKKQLAEETAFNNGKYTDVTAKGHNKNANYKGDYKTNKEARKSGYKFQNLESVEEIGTPDRFASVIVNDNRQSFSGKERKSSLNQDKKYGKYTDKEVNKKQDNLRNAAAYQDKSYYNKDEIENEKDAYLHGNHGRKYDAGDYKKGYGNYGYVKQPKKSRVNDSPDRPNIDRLQRQY